MFDLRPLASGPFRHIAASYWVNELGNWISDIALAVLVYDRTRSPWATAVLFLALRFAPALLAPLLVTRFETLSLRRALPAIYLAEGAIFVTIALLADHFVLSLVLLLCGLDGIFAITAKALTRSAAATTLSADGLLREGNALLNLGGSIGGAAGPAVAGMIVATSGAATALLVDAGTFVLAALLIGTGRSLRIESNLEAGVLDRARLGLEVLRTRPVVSRLLVAVALALSLSSVAVPIEVVFAKQTLHAGDTGYGLLLGSWGIGMIAGSTAYATARRASLGVALAVGAGLIAVGYGGMALAPTLALACAFSAVGGAGNGSAWIAAVTGVQQGVPLTSQSVVMAVLEGVNQVMPAAGFIVGGAVTALSSPRIAYAISSVGVAIVLLVFFRPLRDLKLTPPQESPASRGGIHLATPADHAPHTQALEARADLQPGAHGTGNRMLRPQDSSPGARIFRMPNRPMV